MFEQLEGTDPEEWWKFCLSYDNMCHVDELRAARVSLPLGTATRSDSPGVSVLTT